MSLTEIIERWKGDQAHGVKKLNVNGTELRKKKVFFERTGGVVECNSICTCPATCVNRVDQRPREIGVQVFKTHDKRGWGVRSMTDIAEGRMISMYTGLIIQRQDVQNLAEHRASYCFDLDVLERLDEERPPGNSYTVGASGCGTGSGNWTRFINHSCEPNLETIPVMYETMLQVKPIGPGSSVWPLTDFRTIFPTWYSWPTGPFELIPSTGVE
ncbi:hypothetical protein C8R43DRAFT_962047 [Mycena crocata]|nr:hypothetical protein C8R43DRAFT_962047 [Mycena crocata]